MNAYSLIVKACQHHLASHAADIELKKQLTVFDSNCNKLHVSASNWCSTRATLMCVSRLVPARRLTRRLQATGALDGRILALCYGLGIRHIHYHSGV
jgi:hypothetical protein